MPEPVTRVAATPRDTRCSLTFCARLAASRALPLASAGAAIATRIVGWRRRLVATRSRTAARAGLTVLLPALKQCANGTSTPSVCGSVSATKTGVPRNHSASQRRSVTSGDSTGACDEPVAGSMPPIDGGSEPQPVSDAINASQTVIAQSEWWRWVQCVVTTLCPGVEFVWSACRGVRGRARQRRGSALRTL